MEHTHKPAKRILLAASVDASSQLAREGFVVNVVPDEATVLETLERETYDILLMDPDWRDGAGLLAARTIRDRESHNGRHLPIVAILPEENAATNDRCLASGIDTVWHGRLEAGTLASTMDALKHPSSPSTNTQLSLDEVMEQVDGDVELLASIVDVYFDQREEIVGNVERAVAQRDAATLQLNAHSLKGAVSVFGAKPTREAAFVLEEIGASADWTGVEEALESLMTQLSGFEPELRALAARIASGELADASAP